MHFPRSPLAFFALVGSALSLALACSDSPLSADEPIGATSEEPSSSEAPAAPLTPGSAPAITGSGPQATPPSANPPPVINPSVPAQATTPAPTTTPTTGCAAGEAMCDGACVNLSEDDLHCGECGNACPDGSGCAEGGCFCLVGLIACDGGCVDVNAHPSHCGACGAACAADAVCANGACSTEGCGDASLTACGGGCVNLASDALNCGACGIPCPAGNVCAAGSCECPGGQALCNGQCTDTQMNPQHCGACGVACGLGQLCTAGACSCPDTQEFCGSGCVTVANNALHCGACGNACPSGVCNNGTCAPYEAGDTVIGWASVDGGTTGGANAETVDVASASEFNSNTSGTTPRVVRVTSNISGQLEITGSNKTIVGASADITINGGITIANVDNVIVRNLRVNGSSSSEDGLLIDNATHIWIDHCEFYDAVDGNLDIKNAADLITISWSKFYYSANPPSEDHRFSNLIGSGDGDTQDRGRLRVTWHHNWWADRVHERMPRVRFGQVHVFNNYYSSNGNNYCIRAGVEASILVENNYFDRVDSPHEIEAAGSSIVANDNFYNATTGAQDEAGTAFDPPYEYTMESAESVANSVRAGAGPQ